MIVGTSGLAGSGKDTVSDFLVGGHGFVKIALADELKRTAQRWYDFTDVQLWGPSEMRNAPDKRYPRTRLKAAQDGQAITADEVENAGHPELVEHLTPRFVLQFLGTEAGRMFYPDTWIDLTLRVARELLDSPTTYRYSAKGGLTEYPDYPRDGEVAIPKGVVIPDVRFKNEIAGIRKAGGKLVRIVRPAAGLQGAASQHRSETEQQEIPDSEFDFVLHNDSTLQMLELKTASMMDRLTGRIRDYSEAEENTPPALRKK